MILNEKLQKTNPFAGNNSGKWITAIIERVFQQATEIKKMRNIIPIIAILCRTELS